MKKDQITNIVFYGVGGQGVLSAAEVCGWAAMLAGFHVKKTEVHGMAQRGGSVESFIRFGKKVFSPIPLNNDLDFLVCLYPEEHPRFRSELKKGGRDLLPFLSKGLEIVGNKKQFLNTFMLGVLSSDLVIPENCWLQAIEKVLRRSPDENKEIFLQGRNMGGKDDL